MVVDSYNSEKYNKPTFRSTGTKALLGFGNASFDILGGGGTELEITQYYDSLVTLKNKVQQHNTDIFSSQQQIPKNAQEWVNALNAVDDELAKIKPKIDTINQLAIDQKALADAGNTAPKTTGGTTVPTNYEFTPESLKSLLEANKISLATYLNDLRKIKKDQYSEYLNKSAQDINNMLNNSATAEKTKAYLGLEQDIQSASSKTAKQQYSNNPALDYQLKILDHQKHMNKLTIEDEIKKLKIIKDLYTKNEEERLSLDERIYDTQKSLQNKALQNSENWISEMTAYGKISTEEIIAAWERVKTKQKDNVEAVKEANKGIFDAYKDLLNEQQGAIKSAYNDRMDQIDKEKKAKLDAIDETLKENERTEKTYDYNQKKADLQKELAYWSARNDKKKIAEINKQIADEEHNRQVELTKQGLEDKKDSIEKDAETEKEKWKTAYKILEQDFSDHNMNIIALAASQSKKAFQAWVDNYLVPLQNALKSGNLSAFEKGVDKGHQYGMSDSDFAKFNANGAAWASASAANKIKLQAENDAMRAHYGIPAGKYPQFHTGAETLSYGIAEFKPGELVFPPSLSTDLKALISALTGRPSGQMHSVSTDNRRQINLNGPLLNIENNQMEDEVDATIFSREIKRALVSLV